MTPRIPTCREELMGMLMHSARNQVPEHRPLCWLLCIQRLGALGVSFLPPFLRRYRERLDRQDRHRLQRRSYELRHTFKLRRRKAVPHTIWRPL